MKKDEPGGIDDVDTWLAITVAMIPVGAIVAIVATYILAEEQNGPLWCLIAGVLVAIVMFVVLYALYATFRFNSAPHTSVVTYSDLCERMHRVASLDLIDTDDPSLRAAASAAAADLVRWGQAFDYGRSKRGLQWVLGKGYVDLTRAVHRAEEAAILYEPISFVFADGLRDQSRIVDSTIPHADELVNRLRRALITLNPSSAGYLPQLPPAHAGPPDAADSSLSVQTLARVIVSNARYTVDEFRDSATARLLDARNELLARMFLTGLATWLLVVFVVLTRPPELTLLTSAILYSIGATVGLFSRLYADLSSDSFGSDYAVSYVRLFQAFLLSGHAALAGVYIAVALPVVLNNPVLQVAPTATVAVTATVPSDASLLVTATPPVATGGLTSTFRPTPTVGSTIGAADRGSGGLPRPIDVYNIDRYPFGIVLALIFGLTPGLLISRLSQGIENYKQDLRSSELSTKSGT
ncbi:MAG TPA: hypothetical protein VKT80_17705 [Chloroflexota bacterium]|nr:hypothetical protein [Chloroflexota bacterium]